MKKSLKKVSKNRVKKAVTTTRKQSHILFFEGELELVKKAALLVGLKYGTWGRMTLLAAAKATVAEHNVSDPVVSTTSFAESTS